MVHGNYYGIHYVVTLNNPIDYYDDLLPICSSVRSKLTFYKNNPTKICIISQNELINTLDKTDEGLKFVDSLNKLYFKCIGSQQRKEFYDLFLYYDVFIYSEQIKNHYIIPVSKETFMEMDERLNFLSKKNIEYGLYGRDEMILTKEEEIEFEHLKSTVNLQRILQDPDYFIKVMETEKKITSIPLKEEQERRVNIILNHPLIKNNIKKYGYEIMMEYY
jgi:hypothetical protein